MKLKSIFVLATAALITSNADAQYSVATAGKKYILLEEGTGAWCGYCSDGAQVLQQNVEPANPTYLFVASFHNTYHAPTYQPEDDMELTGDPFNTGTGYSAPGFPFAAINRVPFTHPTSTGMPVTQVGDNRGYWQSDIATLNPGGAPNFDVTMNCSFNPTTSLLTVKITSKVLTAQTTGQWNVNAYVLEDSISTDPTVVPTGLYQQHSYMYSGPTTSWFYNLCTGPCPGASACSSCALIPPTHYSHMNVVEKILANSALTGGIWGDKMFTAPLTVGQTATQVYTYTVPAKFVGDNGTYGGPGWPINTKHLKVVGMIEKYGATTSDRAIENSIESLVKLMPTTLEEGEISSKLQDVSIFPNPATNSINVKFGVANPAQTKISVKNVSGQVVLEKSYAAAGTQFNENILLNNFSNGMYFLTIECGDLNTTKEFTVSK